VLALFAPERRGRAVVRICDLSAGHLNDVASSAVMPMLNGHGERFCQTDFLGETVQRLVADGT